MKEEEEEEEELSFKSVDDVNSSTKRNAVNNEGMKW